MASTPSQSLEEQCQLVAKQIADKEVELETLRRAKEDPEQQVFLRESIKQLREEKLLLLRQAGEAVLCPAVQCNMCGHVVAGPCCNHWMLTSPYVSLLAHAAQRLQHVCSWLIGRLQAASVHSCFSCLAYMQGDTLWLCFTTQC